jgi:hypothetical protein
VFVAAAGAGVLDSHGAAYNGWTGSTLFVNGNLAGYVDYAVFTAANFNANFGGNGYTPTAALVYTYQVFATGSADITSFSVALANPAQDQGAFNPPAGDAPSSSFLTPPPGEVLWNFTAIDQGESSIGLAFSSNYIPTNLFGSVVNSGASAMVAPLPSPSGEEIPEPATLSLLGIGALAMIRRRK